MIAPISQSHSTSSERLLSKFGQHVRRLVHLLAVVFEQLVLFLVTQSPERLLDVPRRVLAAHHEPNLPTRIGWDRGPRILDDGKDFFAGLLELGDHLHVEPWILGCVNQKLAGVSEVRNVQSQYKRHVEGCTTLGRDDAAFSQRTVQKLEVWLLEQTFCRSLWV